MRGIKTGDLVRMKTHETGLVGIVVGRHPVAISTTTGEMTIFAS